MSILLRVNDSSCGVFVEWHDGLRACAFYSTVRVQPWVIL
mgnify:CR=1 FL=1